MAAVAYGAKKQAEKRENKQPRSVFEKYDKDKSGKLDKDELLGAFADLGVHVKLKELDVYVKHYGKNEKIKFEAFDKLLTAMQELEDEKQADLEKYERETKESLELEKARLAAEREDLIAKAKAEGLT